MGKKSEKATGLKFVILTRFFVTLKVEQLPRISLFPCFILNVKDGNGILQGVNVLGGLILCFEVLLKTYYLAKCKHCIDL